MASEVCETRDSWSLVARAWRPWPDEQPRRRMMEAAERRRLLAAIHVCKKNACLSDPDYRAVLREVVGLESAADCNPVQLRKLAGHFKSFEKRAAHKNAGDNFYRIIEGTPNWRQKRHIAAMWVELGYRASGLDTRARQQFGASDFTRLTGEDLQTLGRDLAKRLARRGRDLRGPG